ncbi:hypothetical protein CYCD_01240 [Tenuifilaceae bacterium CYCD]|nr:hypothetical protein CYCD_01240 [Tenuifilaceae bacterium CYCD]
MCKAIIDQSVYIMETINDIDVVTIQGGSLLEHPFHSITYRVRCEKCGDVESEKHTLSLTQGVTEVASVQCATCGHVQMVKIRNPRRN